VVAPAPSLLRQCHGGARRWRPLRVSRFMLLSRHRQRADSAPAAAMLFYAGACFAKPPPAWRRGAARLRGFETTRPRVALGGIEMMGGRWVGIRSRNWLAKERRACPALQGCYNMACNRRLRLSRRLLDVTKQDLKCTKASAAPGTPRLKPTLAIQGESRNRGWKSPPHNPCASGAGGMVFGSAVAHPDD
jgi:hypothetical protein